MRKTLLMSAALLGMAVAAPAFAQSGTSATQSPPSPNAGVSEPQSSGSLPPGAGTASGMRPGDAIGGTRTAPPPPMTPARPMTGVRPMRGQQAEPMRDMPPSRMGTYNQTRGMPPAGGTGVGSGRGMDGSGGNVPLSTRASNIDRADTRSIIAPRLPNPDASGNTPEAFLMAAQRALAAGQTGRAQEALERAETRLLTRSTDPSMANTPDNAPMVMQISQARQALARRDTAGARQAIDMAMAGNASGAGVGSQGGMSTGGGMGTMPSGGMGTMPQAGGMGSSTR